jgi:hypothetical protein
MKYVIICLGTEPKVFGPFESELEADEDLERYCPATEEHPLGLCENGLTADEHHVLPLLTSIA